jgi:hypothetical protein
MWTKWILGYFPRFFLESSRYGVFFTHFWFGSEKLDTDVTVVETVVSTSELSLNILFFWYIEL